MSEITLNKLKEVSKSNFLWGILNTFVTLPLLVYVSTLMISDEDKWQFDFNHYLFQVLQQPMLFSLIILVVVNAIVDFLVYKNHQKAILKIRLMFVNLAYLLFMIFKVLFFNTGTDNYVIFGVLVAILIYKLFRYHQYYRFWGNR